MFHIVVRFITSSGNGFANAKYSEHTGKIYASFRYGQLDGHQVSKTYKVDPGTLKLEVFGARQSHCFGNSISVFPDRSVSIMSLGDAYCRGIDHDLWCSRFDGCHRDQVAFCRVENMDDHITSYVIF